MHKLFTNISATMRRTQMYDAVTNERQRYHYRRWVAAGKNVPPPYLVKQMVIIEIATARPDLRIFVETGTYFGDMVHAVRNSFSAIYSIELGVELHELARRRFAHLEHVHIRHGDSGEVLEELLREVKEPCLFWLDGHYSAGVTARGAMSTPIEKELTHIAEHRQRNRHVVLIDDARLFTGAGDYPSIDRLRFWASSNGFDQFAVCDDIVRISATRF
jgi:hypothetical protein